MLFYINYSELKKLKQKTILKNKNKKTQINNNNKNKTF